MADVCRRCFEADPLHGSRYRESQLAGQARRAAVRRGRRWVAAGVSWYHEREVIVLGEKMVRDSAWHSSPGECWLRRKPMDVVVLQTQDDKLTALVSAPQPSAGSMNSRLPY